MRLDIPEAFKFLDRPARIKCAYGGRGSGKSWTFAILLLLYGIRSPLKILCGREFQASINDSVKSLLDNTIGRLELWGHYQSLKTEIISANGTRFLFCGLRHDPHKIKSMEGVDVFWGEEANTISRESLDLLIPTIRKEKSELWFSYNRKLENEPVHALASRPDAVSRKINYYDNPYFPEVLRREMEYDRSHNYEKYLHVWQGEPQELSEAMVFKGRFRVEPFEATEFQEVFYFGADWGFSVDPSVLVRCWISEDGYTLYIDYEAYGVGIEIDKLAGLFRQVPLSDKYRITADSARPETISYVRRQGFNVHPAKKGKDSVIEGVEFLKTFDIVCHPRCKNAAYELAHYSYKTDRLSGDVLPVLEDDNNHVMDALRYATESVRRRSTIKGARILKPVDN